MDSQLLTETQLADYTVGSHPGQGLFGIGSTSLSRMNRTASGEGEVRATGAFERHHTAIDACGGMNPALPQPAPVKSGDTEDGGKSRRNIVAAAEYGRYPPVLVAAVTAPE